MDRRVKTAMWALGGLALAIALSMTAYAVAGGRLSEPAGSVRVIPSAAEEGNSPGATETPRPEPSDEPSSGGGAQPSQSDDHGGSSTSSGSTSSGSEPGTDASDDDADSDD
jgi:hypothetical protein